MTDATGGRTTALLVLTRDPSGPRSGRLSVLATLANGLEACGLRVEVAALTRQPPAPWWEGRRVHHVAPPEWPEVGLSVLRAVLRRGASLNEALYDGRGARRAVARLAARVGAGLVVADTVRTWGPAASTGLPVLLHLDDLLSERYRLLAGGRHHGADVLGFYAAQVPGPLLPLAQLVAGRVLGLEARLLAGREVATASAACVAATTSRGEAEELARRSHRRVVALPMAVDPVSPPAEPARSPATSMVFLGLMDYGPNIAALRWWRQHVRPALVAAGGHDIVLTVVGRVSPALREELTDPHLRFTGYVEDLAAELRRHRASVAPVVIVGGVKTKVLDAMAVGLPVVGTPAALEGLGAEPDTEVLVAATADAFADAVLRLRDSAGLAARVGAAARALVARDWSGAVADDRLAEVLMAVPGLVSRPSIERQVTR